MEYVLVFALGVVVGSVVVLVFNRWQRQEMEKSFSALSLDALRRNSEDFLKLAYEALSRQTQVGAGELEGKKRLIDQTLEGIKGDLQKVERLVTEFDNRREKSFGEVTTHLRLVTEQTDKLQATTGKLQAVLANTRARGQWGERMAEDILQLVGFVENVNYIKQKTQETTRSRPDYTFVLPQNLKVNMDVKFPLDNYLNYLNAGADADREAFKQKFLADARQRVREVRTRDYINPEEDTVDYALLFIPNEQVFCFLNENGSILDEALKDKIILCSPVTLFAILCVIRKAVEVFSLNKTTADILSLLDAFDKQWSSFKESMDKMGKKIDEAQKEYNTLITTRSSQLERPLRKIGELKQQRGIVEPSSPEGQSAP
ncbi:MAG: DNA recombination protein RmuC [Dehalococcoidales bacterium]|nr:DNA recombination protein RmuC [Dehalococcoidales bacterium]